jgi:dipeptidyl-peptidase 4
MKLHTFLLFLGLALPSYLPAQGALADYRRAEARLPWNARKLAFEGEVTPHWIGKSERFWYRNERPDRREFILMDAERNLQQPAFDHAKLAEALSRVVRKPYTAARLPFKSIDFAEGKPDITFEVEGKHWICNLAEYGCREETERKKAGTSPDGKWQAEVRQYNLYLRNSTSGEEVQITKDGEKNWSYATPLPDSQMMIEQRTEDVKQPPAVFWSPDSTKLVTYRIDSRKAGRFIITQNAPPFQLRPVSFSVVYPLPGEEVSTAEPLVFDVATRKLIRVNAEPLEILFQEGPEFRWLHDSAHFTFDFTERGYKRIELREADAATGDVRILIQERSNTFVDPGAIYQKWFHEDSEILWSSERDGWNHLYLYDVKSVKLENQVTKGDWVVRAICHVDEKARQAYFLGGGREPGRDPYLTNLYRVNLDGSGLTLLTPQDANHKVEFSPSGKYFVDAYSRPDVPPVSELRRADGGHVRKFEGANIDALLRSGFRYPEPFRGTGRDGKTDVYGIIWRPSNLDASKKYPVVEQIYTGPQSFFVPKTFAAYRNIAQAIAELGFIVVQIDGLGTAGRSKAFHDHCYKNLGDGGVDDHIALLRQMAVQYPYMDLNRVGLYGTSAGGYDAAHAMLTHPKFYKVGVSTSGCHDNRMDKAWWNELWMSYPVGDEYKEQSNVTLAKNLEGRLLLFHGDLDHNVNVAETLQLVNALIQVNKDFDMVLVPNMYHGDGDNMWVMRRRWDYFVKNLLGVTPPREYHIQQPPEDEFQRPRRTD